jgi:hypothetical protein
LWRGAEEVNDDGTVVRFMSADAPAYFSASTAVCDYFAGLRVEQEPFHEVANFLVCEQAGSLFYEDWLLDEQHTRRQAAKKGAEGKKKKKFGGRSFWGEGKALAALFIVCWE